MRSRFGFTVAEVVVAAMVLSLFIAGAFAFYRMGNRIFLAGSWRLNTSKQAELFLSTLKEHIEMCNTDSVISAGSITTAEPVFNVIQNERVINASTTLPLNIMAFPVCKADLRAVSNNLLVQNEPLNGLVVYDLLKAASQSLNLFKLELYTSTIQPEGAVVYFKNVINHSVDSENPTNPRGFGLNLGKTAGGYGHVYRLADVYSLKISRPPDGSSNEDDPSLGKTVGIAIECRHPTIRNTFVKHQIQALLDIHAEVRSF